MGTPIARTPSHYRIAGGKLASFNELTDDQATFDHAWRTPD